MSFGSLEVRKLKYRNSYGHLYGSRLWRREIKTKSQNTKWHERSRKPEQTGPDVIHCKKKSCTSVEDRCSVWFGVPAATRKHFKLYYFLHCLCSYYSRTRWSNTHRLSDSHFLSPSLIPLKTRVPFSSMILCGDIVVRGTALMQDHFLLKFNKITSTPFRSTGERQDVLCLIKHHNRQTYGGRSAPSILSLVTK
jgi:hypothetical protein